jgi:DNA polymerase-3 subunit gamma/tau
MSYQALYRKFRPDNFGDVKGQDAIVKTLKNQIASGRIGHAYLFCGTRGTGKTTIAKIFAKAVNCENPGENGPCNECAICKSIQSQTSMNVVEIDAASNNRVDDIRQVIEEVQYAPSEGKYKVYIIDEVHMLSTSAFNALLKTLEEPPEYLIFILATTEAHKIPLTILSRCQRYDFKRISVDTITARLQELMDKEGIEAEEKALRYIAKAADGAMRDGLSLLEQCVSFYYGEKLTYENVLKVLGAVDNHVYGKMTEALAAASVKDVIHVLDDVVSQGKDLTQFTNEFVWYLRNLLLLKSSEEGAELIEASQENIDDLKAKAELLETEMIFRFIRVLSDLANQLKFATSKRVLMEVALIKLCRPQMERDYDSLVQRLHNIEMQLEEGVVVSAPPSSPSIAPENPVPKVDLPKAVPEDVEQIVQEWGNIVVGLGPVEQAMLNNVKLNVGQDGRLLIYFVDETSLDYFKEKQRKEEFEREISNRIGKEVTVDMKSVGNKAEHDQLPDLRSKIKINSNVNMTFID